jgi:hypothetical protein
MIVFIMICQLVHGFNATQMADQFNVSASTIKKYVDIVYDVLIDKDKLLSKYINIASSQSLKDIIVRFENLTSILNICGVIDGIQIPLANFPSKKVTFVMGDFFNTKKFHDIVLQAMCDADKIFWNVCVGQPGGVHDGGQFKRCSLYKQLKF